METTAALDAALAGDSIRLFMCGQIDLPGRTVRLLEGPGVVTWSQGTFTGEDAVFGSLDSFETLSDGVGDQAPQLSIRLNPQDDADAAELCTAAMQGAKIKIWLGALYEDGTVIPDPYLIFDGELDQPTLTIEVGKRTIDYECVSSFEKLFMNEEGNRLSPTHHKEIWPGETGLDAITGIVRNIVWGPGEKIGEPPTGTTFDWFGSEVTIQQ